MRWAIALCLWACGSNSEPPPPTATPPSPPAAPARTALLDGELPSAAEATIVRNRCELCHTTDYLTQQRLTEAGWKKTVDKMRKFGAALSDAEAAAVVSYAVRHWNPELPGRTWKTVGAPAGATPLE